MNNNAGLNKVMLAGKIVREPRWHLCEGTRKLCFTLMTREIIRSPGGDVEHHELHLIKAGEDRPNMKRLNLKKGDIVYVQGKLHTHAFTDEENIKRYKTTVIVTQIDLFDPEPKAPGLPQITEVITRA